MEEAAGSSNEIAFFPTTDTVLALEGDEFPWFGVAEKVAPPSGNEANCAPGATGQAEADGRKSEDRMRAFPRRPTLTRGASAMGKSVERFGEAGGSGCRSRAPL